MEARRGTLMPNGPLGNAYGGSSIPVPSSAMKKPPARLNGSGMSTAARPSTMSGGHGVGMSRTASQENMAGRRSTMASRGGGDTLGASSANRGDGGMYGHGRVAPSSVRRSSVFPGRQSMAPGGGGMMTATVKDTRPVKDSNFKQSCQNNIAEFLHMSRSNIIMTPKLLISPTGKEFQEMFKHLINFLVDGFSWGKSFEQECWQLLRDLRYPSADQCGKTALSAPGSPQHWPFILAMLNWLVDLCKAHDSWMSPDMVSDPLLMPASDLPLDHPSIEDRMFWDYSAKTYTAWFDQAAEDFPEADAELDDFYNRLTQSTFEESERLESQVQRLTVDLKGLQAQGPPLKQEEDTYLHLKSDKTKFVVFMEQLAQKHEKLQQTIARSKASSAELERQLEQVRGELAHTEGLVAAQNLSPDEVTRMTHERETMTRQLKDVRDKVLEANNANYEHEVSLARLTDRFDAFLNDYTSLGHQIGTIPTSMDGPATGPGGVDYSIDITLATEEMSEVQETAKRMRDILRPALGRYDEEIRGETRKLGEEQARLDSEYDKLGLMVEKQKSDVANKELELSKQLESAESAKAAHATNSSQLQANVKKLEDRVADMTTQTQKGLVHDQSQVEDTRMALQELKHKTVKLQDYVVDQMAAHMDIIVKAKEHVDRSLKSVRQMAESQT